MTINFLKYKQAFLTLHLIYMPITWVFESLSIENKTMPDSWIPRVSPKYHKCFVKTNAADDVDS